MRNISVIGCGDWGKNLIRNFNTLGALYSVCDLDINKKDEIIKKYGKDIIFTTSYKEVFRDPKIKAVAIATQADMHYSVAKEALLHNKDVFVEKPLALNFKQGKLLTDLAKEKGRILMVGHLLQYHPAVIKLKELIDKKELGKIQYIYSNRLNIGKLRKEENILWSFAPHDISVILMLVGSEPMEIGCFGDDYLNEGIFDVTLTTLVFKDKIKAHIFVNWLHPFKEQKLVVIGSQAMAVFDDMTQEKLFIYPHRVEWKDGRIPVAHKAEHYCMPVKNKEPLMEEVSHFIECIAKRKMPKTDGKEGTRVLKVLEAAEKILVKSPFNGGISI